MSIHENIKKADPFSEMVTGQIRGRSDYGIIIINGCDLTISNALSMLWETQNNKTVQTQNTEHFISVVPSIQP